MAGPVISVSGLCKTYGDLHAVRDISFEVQRGEIFGIIGPNGAGKTTTVECLEGIRKPDSGQIRLLGLDPHLHARKLKHKMGMQLQESRLPDRLRVREAMRLFAKFYSSPVDPDELLERLGLSAKRNAYFDHLSGGQKQRLSVAMALINDPEIVFFDELTTGLDPQARRAIWDLVKGIREQGKTVVLVTHFMDEAQKLCDRVALVDHGQVVALDTPQALINSTGGHLRICFQSPSESMATILETLGKEVQIALHQQAYTISTGNIQVIADVINLLTGNDIDFSDFHIEQASLEDVFIRLTGHELRD